MTLNYQQVKVYKKTPSGWSDTAITLNELGKDSKCKIGVGKKKDIFSFSPNNANGKLYQTFHSGDGSTNSFAWAFGTIPTETEAAFEVFVSGVLQIEGTDYVISGTDVAFTYFPADVENNIELRFPVIDQEDLVQIYFRTGDNSFVENDIPLEGWVDNVDRLERGSSNSIRVSGIGMIEALFGILSFALNPDQTATEMIQNDLIPHVANYIATSGRTILWNPANDLTTTDIDYTAKYKRAVEIVEDLASDPVNKEGYFYYSMSKVPDTSNTYYLNFNKKLAAGSTTDVITGSTSEPLDVQLGYRKEIINAAIFNCGRDPNGNPIESLHFNRDKNIAGSTTWKYITDTGGIASELIDAEFQADTSKWETTDDGNRAESFPTEYPYTMQFTVLDRAGNTKDDQEISNDNEFNDAIKNKALARGRNIVQRVMDRGAARKEASFFKQFSSVTEFTLGGLIELTSDKQGFEEVLLRVEEIQFTPTKIKVIAIEDEVIV